MKLNFRLNYIFIDTKIAMHLQHSWVLVLLSIIMSLVVSYSVLPHQDDICNIEGSSCQDKCCREHKCKSEAKGLVCCDDPDSEATCSNCPKCGRCK